MEEQTLLGGPLPTMSSAPRKESKGLLQLFPFWVLKMLLVKYQSRGCESSRTTGMSGGTRGGSGWVDVHEEKHGRKSLLLDSSSSQKEWEGSSVWVHVSIPTGPTGPYQNPYRISLLLLSAHE